MELRQTQSSLFLSSSPQRNRSSLQKSQMINVPEKFICPLLLQMIDQPVCVNNKNYEATAFLIDKTNYDHISITPNQKLKQEIKDFKAHWVEEVNHLNKQQEKKYYLCTTVQDFLHLAASPQESFNNVFYFSTLLNAIDMFGRNAVQIATHRGNHSFIQNLLSENNHSNLDHQDFLGQSALHIATIQGYAEISKDLLNYGANPILQDKKGNTALHYAVLKNQLAITQQLLDLNIDIDIENFERKRAIELAANNSTEIYPLLLDRAVNGYEERHPISKKFVSIKTTFVGESLSAVEKDNILFIREILKLRSENKTLHSLNKELLELIHESHKIVKVPEEQQVHQRYAPMIRGIVTNHVNKLKRYGMFNIQSKKNPRPITLLEKPHEIISI